MSNPTNDKAIEDLRTTVDELQRELRSLRDRQAILDVVAAYARAIDRGDEAMLRDCYHPDALDRHGPFLGTREEFVPWALDHCRPLRICHHSITTQICEVQGDQANAESYVIFFSERPNKTRCITGAGRYLDDFERRDGRWAIIRRCEVLDCVYEYEPSDMMGAAWTEIQPRRDPGDPSYTRPLQLPEPLPTKHNP